MSLLTTDLSDAHPAAQVCAPLFRDFGGRERFHGPIATVKVFEDNTLVRAALEQPGEGRVLVVDGGGSTRCALVGGQLGELAVGNDWQGILVYGCVRDVGELAQQAVGIKALASHPRKSLRGLHGGQPGVAVRFADVLFQPGAWLYADQDGVLVSPDRLHP